VDDFAIVPVEAGDVRAIDQALASEPKRAGSVRGWGLALLDFDPSVSLQGEAGGSESAALDKARPRPV
jgi:hypothetical protein